MKCLILYIMLLELILSGSALPDDIPADRRQPRCKKPLGKPGQTLVKSCTDKEVCTLDAKNKARWQTCPIAASGEDLAAMDSKLNDVDSKIDGVESKIDGVDSKIDGVDSKIDGVDSKIDGVDSKIDGVDSKIDGVDTKIDGVDSKIDGVDSKIDSVDSKIEDVKVDLKELNKQHIEIIRLLHDIIGCPSGWSLYESSCYRFYSASIGWTQAQEECQNEKSNLASVTNVGIKTFIGGLQKDNHAFIGGSKPASSNPKIGWEWLDNTPWSYTNWRTNEPSHTHEFCIAQLGKQYGNEWNNVVCSYSGYDGYVCEKHWTA